MLLAQSATFMGVEVTTLIAVVSALGVLFGIWKKMNSAQDEVIARIKKEMRFDQVSQVDGQKREIGPQPFVVTTERRMATFEELNEVKARVAHLDGAVEGIRADIQTGIEKLKLEGSRRAASIHGRVDNLNVTVAKVEERSEINSVKLTQLDGKIDRVLERLKA